jgi:hypothetical protein
MTDEGNLTEEVKGNGVRQYKWNAAGVLTCSPSKQPDRGEHYIELSYKPNGR